MVWKKEKVILINKNNMFKNIDKVKKNIGETVFNHINSLNKSQLEKQLSELKDELKSENKDGQRYLKLKDEEFYLLYRLERANEFKYKDGGSMKNYSKSDLQSMSDWSLVQLYCDKMGGIDENDLMIEVRGNIEERQNLISQLLQKYAKRTIDGGGYDIIGGARTVNELSLPELETQLNITKPNETERIKLIKKLIEEKSDKYAKGSTINVGSKIMLKHQKGYSEIEARAFWNNASHKERVEFLDDNGGYSEKYANYDWSSLSPAVKDEVIQVKGAKYAKGSTVGTNSQYEELYRKANNNIQGALELYAGELGIYNMFFGHKVDATKKAKVKSLQAYLENKYSNYAKGSTVNKYKNGGGIDINELNMPVIRTQFEEEDFEFEDGGGVNKEMENLKNIKIKQAINDIVTYATLPPQIDYVLPYKIKSIKAEEYLMSLPYGEKHIARARKQIEQYYSEDGAAQYNALFDNGGKIKNGGNVVFSPVAVEKANIEELFEMAEEIGLKNYHNLNKEFLRKKILQKFNVEFKTGGVVDIVTYKGKKYKKQSNNKWLEISKHGLTKEEHSEKTNEFAKKPNANWEYNFHLSNSNKLSNKEYIDKEIGLNKGKMETGGGTVEGVKGPISLSAFYYKNIDKHNSKSSFITAAKKIGFKKEDIESLIDNVEQGGDKYAELSKDVFNKSVINRKDGGAIGDDNLNENGVHKGYLALTNYWDAARKPLDLNNVPITKIRLINKESVLNYLDSLEIIPDYLEGKVPRYNPDLGDGPIEENYLLLDKETQDIYFIDTQGYNYPRYMTKLIDYDREEDEFKNGGGIDINELNMPVIRTQFEEEDFEFEDGGKVQEVVKGKYYNIYDPGMDTWNDWEYISYIPGYHIFREEAPMGSGTEIKFTNEELKSYLTENLIKNSYRKGGRVRDEKPLSYYKYSTPRVNMAWNGKIQQGGFYSAEEAMEAIKKQAQTKEELTHYSIVTPDKVIHLGKEYAIRYAQGGSTKGFEYTIGGL